MLDDTIVIWAVSSGAADSQGNMVATITSRILIHGGRRRLQARDHVWTTDELGYAAEENPVSVHDFTRRCCICSGGS